MKRIKKIVIAGLLVIAMTASLTGCTKATPQNLLNSMAKKMTKVKSFDATVVMNMEAKGAAMGVDVSMKMDMKLDMKAVKDPMAAHIKGNMALSAMGQSQDMDMEAYTVVEDKKLITYAAVEGAADWTREESDLKDQKSSFDLGGLAKAYESFELAEKLKEVEGKECFILNGEVEGDTLEKILNGSMNTAGDAAELFDGVEWDGKKIPIELAIEKKTQYPVTMKIDMKDLLGAMFESQLAGLGCDQCEITMTYNSFDKEKKIEVPKDVKEKAAAETDGDSEADGEIADIFAGNQDSGTDAAAGELSKEALKGAAQAKELGKSWDSYTVSINGKVLTLPCTYQEFAATGLVLDADGDTQESTIINAHDTEYAYFADPKAEYSSIDVTVLNNSDKAVNVKNCLIGSISIGDYSLEKSKVKIIFPGKITIGSALEQAISAYGKPSYQSNNDDSGGASWEDRNVYSKGMNILADKSGKITYIEMECIEK